MDISTILQAGANFVTILGIIVAVLGLSFAIRTYNRDRKKDQLEREYGTFHDLDDKYVDFMYECAKHPRLDLFSTPASKDRCLGEEEIRTERAHYAVLISIFERAYVMFHRRGELSIKEAQYPGWEECMRSYCTRESFLAEWNLIGKQFDEDFQTEMIRIIQSELKANKPLHAAVEAAPSSE